MLSEMFYKLWNNGLIQLGIWETIYMTLISSAIAYVIGLPLGVILSVTDANGIRPTPWVNRILGYSAMAATIGGTGLGQIAIIYGHQRSNDDITWICVLLTVVIVQIIQIVGTYIARKTDKRIK